MFGSGDEPMIVVPRVCACCAIFLTTGAIFRLVRPLLDAMVTLLSFL